MGNVAKAKAAYFKSVTASNQTAVADLEAEYYEKALAGTVTPVAPATATVNGTVKKAATVAPATDAATVITQLNALILSMRAAGQIV